MYNDYIIKSDKGYFYIGQTNNLDDRLISHNSKTFEYAPDGIDFMSDKLDIKIEERAVTPGAFRPDLTNPVIVGEGLKWGISMVLNKHEC
jgi:hypothetical protein